MHATKLKKIAAGTALAISALGATSVAQAGTTPQKPDTGGQIIAVLAQGQIIGVLGHPASLITIRKAGG